MKKTIVINLVGGPGAGKSTFATMLFSSLKKKGVSCEYVDEFAKGLVWEGRDTALKDQLYVLANQNHKLNRVVGKVNVIITDSPLLVSMYYNSVLPEGEKLNCEIFDKLVMECYEKYDNIVYYLERNFPYVMEGRYQTEEESIVVNNVMKKMLDEKGIEYKKITSSDENAEEVSNFIIKLFNLYRNKKDDLYEYERRFLLKDKNLLKIGLPMKHISQTYLKIGQSEKRVRCVDGKQYYWTEKNGIGQTREEFETEISKQEYDYFIKNFKLGKTIEKDRYTIDLNGVKKCEINIFSKPKEIDLVEVEFESEEEMKKFTPPSWFGQEVTDECKYNSYEIALSE